MPPASKRNVATEGPDLPRHGSHPGTQYSRATVEVKVSGKETRTDLSNMMEKEWMIAKAPHEHYQKFAGHFLH